MSNALGLSLVGKTPNCGTLSLPSNDRRPGFHSASTLHLKPAVDLLRPFLNRHRCQNSSGCSAGQLSGGEIDPLDKPVIQDKSKEGFPWKWKMDTAEMSSRAAKLGLAAILAYGLFDGVTYTTFFVLAFLGYEKSTGKNSAANLQALLGIVILMWTGNNFTRPFRVAGAAALAPAIDKQLTRIQKYFKLPSRIVAFGLVAGVVAASCLTVVGLLIFSRWGK